MYEILSRTSLRRRNKKDEDSENEVDLEQRNRSKEPVELLNFLIISPKWSQTKESRCNIKRVCQHFKFTKGELVQAKTSCSIITILRSAAPQWFDHVEMSNLTEIMEKYQVS